MPPSGLTPIRRPYRARGRVALALLLLVGLGCARRAEPAASRWGQPLPEGLRALNLTQPEKFDARGQRILLGFDSDVYLAQAAPLLSALDDAAAEVWMPSEWKGRGYRVALRSEPSFRAWLDSPTPGGIRVVLRADGYELQTHLGKLPGPDPNGPTVPVRGGRMNVEKLREGLTSLKSRFPEAKEACLVPSFGTELAKVSESWAGFYRAPGEPLFEVLCLVYPRAE